MKKYPIRIVSKMTGLTVHTIRIWEKRYQAVEPHRTSTNRRLYSDQDIFRLQLLKKATEMGYSIGQVVKWNASELEKFVTSHQLDSVSSPLTSDSSAIEKNLSFFYQQALEAIRTLNAVKLENILLQTIVSHSLFTVLEKLIVPLLNNIGDSWQKGSIRIYHEHMMTIVIRKFLQDQLLAIRIPPTAPAIVVATPIGQQHELGALIAAVTAASLGWEVIYLGSNLPAEEIAAVIQEKKAQAVLLSIVYPASDPQLKNELYRLRQMTDKNLTLLVGGRAVHSYLPTLQSVEAIIFSDFSQLLHHLNALSAER